MSESLCFLTQAPPAVSASPDALSRDWSEETASFSMERKPCCFPQRAVVFRRNGERAGDDVTWVGEVKPDYHLRPRLGLSPSDPSNRSLRMRADRLEDSLSARSNTAGS